MTTDLDDIEQICQLKARYFRTMDQKDWTAYRGVFAEDAVIDTTDDTGPGTEITGDDTARGIWAMEDQIWFSEASGMGKLWGAGWYEELYRRVDGEWKIERMRLRRQRLELGGVQIFPRTRETEASG